MSYWWVGKSDHDLAMFQLHERLLCMPFEVFRKALGNALKRPVSLDDIALNWEGLKKELHRYPIYLECSSSVGAAFAISGANGSI